MKTPKKWIIVTGVVLLAGFVAWRVYLNRTENKSAGTSSEAKYSSYSVIEATTQGLAVARFSTCPTNNDTDGDKMLDKWEIDHGYDPTDASDGALDSDGDGLSNTDEIINGTDILNQDSDGDGISDSEEVMRKAQGTQNMNPSSDDSFLDQDGDGLSLKEELASGTDPFNNDSDGDGLPDGDEIPDERNVFTPYLGNTNTQGYLVTIIMTESNQDPNCVALMGRARVILGDQIFRVFNTNGVLRRTVRVVAGQQLGFSLIDGRPEDPIVKKVTGSMLVNGVQPPPWMVDDPNGFFSVDGFYFPKSLDNSSNGMTRRIGVSP